MTQEFKSIDTILNEYAVRHDYRDWEQMYYDEGVEIGTLGIESVAKTYAKQFKEANKELIAWKESMMKVHSELDLQKIGNALDMLVGTPIAPNVLPKILELKQSNKELVEMLDHVKGYLGSDQREIVESLITKHKQDGK